MENGLLPVSGVAKIKPEFLFYKDQDKDKGLSSSLLEGPEVKRVKLEGEEEGRDKDGDGDEDGKKKKGPRGQNKNRPRPPKFMKEDKLCPHYWDGKMDTECPNLPGCLFLHDVDKYSDSRTDKVEGECYLFKTYGKCPRGFTCIFADSHIIDGRNVVKEELWNVMKDKFEAGHCQLLDKETQNQLRKYKYDFKEVEKIYGSNASTSGGPLTKEDKEGTPTVASKGDGDGGLVKTCGAVTDGDIIRLKLSEVQKIDWNDKLYLSPLTTVGNLPFRRLCVEMGADITCSEMSLATSILQGNTNEFALHRRHPSEKLWGVQLCSSNGMLSSKAAHVIAECGIDYDFVDLNCGCPLDPIYQQGAGSGLMGRTNKFHATVKGMAKVLAAKDKAFTVKMRTGLKTDKNIAHNLIEFCRDNGVSAVTLHGRTRQQRYLKYADWNYIGLCTKVAQPMALFGNGDVMSWEDYKERKELSNVTGVMIGRGALIKPWVFQEIKEQRLIDLRSSDRLELIRKYVNYGLDHWGSDSQGVSTTRRFLLEWLSFFHRYIPHGILQDPPQRINQRPPRYVGRDEMETLLASPNAADWIKISEMFLGKVPEFFEFVPKHKANAWASNG